MAEPAHKLAAPASDLPDPEQFVRNMVRAALEVLAGVRSPEQLVRWFSEDAFRRLVTRANLSARARSARGLVPTRPVFDIGSVRMSHPCATAVEATVVVTSAGRTRGVAIRLDEFRGRWRVSTLAVL